MHGEKRWNILPQHELTTELASRLKTSPLIAQILLTRGYADPSDCAAFLRPSLKHLHEPATLPGVTRAADRIARAISDREKVVLYGDYVVDGITATAILWHAIRALGGTCEYYIPHRIDEGYGLNAQAIEQLCAGGAKVIVTVDCGITACEEARVAGERGVDLIVTDHHEWHEEEERGDVGTLGRGDVAEGLGASSVSTPARPHDPTTPHSPLPRLPNCYVIVH